MCKNIQLEAWNGYYGCRQQMMRIRSSAERSAGYVKPKMAMIGTCGVCAHTPLLAEDFCWGCQRYVCSHHRTSMGLHDVAAHAPKPRQKPKQKMRRTK